MTMVTERGERGGRKQGRRREREGETERGKKEERECLYVHTCTYY